MLFEQANVKKINKCLNDPNVPTDVKDKLRKYMKQKTENGFKITYKPGKESFDGEGRLYAPLGLQMLPKPVRNYIAEEFYEDIDMRNAQPSILNFLLQDMDIECPELSTYCENREKVFEEYHVDKSYLMSIIYDVNAKPKNRFFRNIHNAVYQDFVPQMQDSHDEMWNRIKSSKKRDLKGNKEGSFVSQVLQNCENLLLQKMVEFFKSKGLKPDVLIFDGVMIRKDEKINDALLRECEEYIYECEDFNGFRISLVNKPMDDILEVDEDVSDKEPPENDADIAEAFTKFTDRHLFWNMKFFYCHDNGVWAEDEEGKQLLEALTSDEFAEYGNFDPKMLRATKKFRSVEFMVKKKLTKPTKAFDFDQNPYLIGTENGVYDLEKEEFRDLKPSDFVSKSVGYAFAKEDDIEVQKELNDLFFSFYEDEQKKEYVLIVLSTGIVGEVCYQNFFIFTGVGANGKSFMGNLMDCTLKLTDKDGYCATLDANYWTEKPNNSNNASPTVHAIKGARVVFSSEPDSGDGIATVTIKSQNIKRLTSGLDAMKSRNLNEKQTTWYPNCTLVLLCNTIPQCTDTDYAWLRRPRVISHPFCFVANVTDPVTQRPARDLNYFLRDLKYRQQFLRMLIRYYLNHIKNNKTQTIPMPASVQKDTNEYFADNDDVQDFIGRRILKTGNDEDRILFRDMYEAFKSSTGSKINSKKFSATMKSKQFKTVKNCDVYFTGVKLIEQNQQVHSSEAVGASSSSLSSST